uniref:HSF-type DNA-binding domain-containing protein n=2 Tax=Chrysotila carterae TaxID=13221 RepID=A0A7S4B7R2_CHRCT|mmetsp:Transcript_6335/g.13825  ORF Transcript_6335/g.13825 Transcript_6335/m.13825 type:complete len:195 (+) Transcript_6335:169-753(+)
MASVDLNKVAPFLIKLFEIVSSPASDGLICWSEYGESFKIIDRTKFAQDVLPLYFKHDNLRSFIRQLNIYGFQRCPNASGRDRTMEFFHPMFTRNGLRNLKDMKRGNQSKKLEDDVMNESSDQPPAKKQRADYSAFRNDVARLQKNLEDFELDLKQHTLQVQQKLAYILSSLDETAPEGSRAAEMVQRPMISSN